MNDVPAVGPPGSLQQDVQTILGAREGMALNKPNTVRSVGMQDFPVPVPGGGPPDEFDSLLSSRMFDALNKPVGPAFPSERTAKQAASRSEAINRAQTRGAGLGGLDAGVDPRTDAQIESAAFAGGRGRALGSFAADLSEMGRDALWEKSQRDLQRTISASRATYNFDIEQSGITGQQQTAALGLADDFYRESGEFFGIDASFRRMSTLAANPSAVGDIGMVFSVMKMYDPRSTVREGEQAQARNTATIPEAMWQTYNRLFIDGESLTVDQRAEFDRVGRDIHETARLLHEDRVTAFNERATAVGVPDHVREKLFRGDTPLPTQEEMRNPHTWAQMVNKDVSLLDTATANMDEEEKIAFRAALEELGITVEVQ